VEKQMNGAKSGERGLRSVWCSSSSTTMSQYSPLSFNSILLNIKN